jgi:uncharacterized membrane protein
LYALIALPRRIHIVHAALLAGSLPLFMGALLSDWAYASTYLVQWINFASWLLAGALVLAGLALLWAVVDFLRVPASRSRGAMTYLLIPAGAWLLGLIDALVHARDAWAAMPAGLMLSIIVFLLALAAAWIGLSSIGERERP